jgi:hypothetical protein
MALKDALLSGMSLRQHTATTTSEDKQSFNRPISPSWKQSSLPEGSDFGDLPDDEIVVQPNAIFSIIFSPLADSQYRNPSKMHSPVQTTSVGEKCYVPVRSWLLVKMVLGHSKTYLPQYP